MRRGGHYARNEAMPAMREDIQDLDRELELLRRKRQMINEQQRQFQPTQHQQPQEFNRGHVISPWQQQPAIHVINPWQQEPAIISSDFNQPRTSYNQNELQSSNLYNSGQSNSGNGFGASPRNKRQFNGPKWQDESAEPKRFRDNRSKTGGNFNPPKKFAPIRKPFQNKPAPKPFNKKKPFTKPNEKPAAGRPNKLLPRTVVTSKPYNWLLNKQAFLENVINNDDNRQYPENHHGRIQFATGIIYRILVGRHKGSQAHTLYRHIMSILYARIHKAMLNQKVGSVQNIIDLYDAAFPSTADDELVEQATAKEAEALKSIQPPLDKSESDKLDSRKTADRDKILKEKRKEYEKRRGATESNLSIGDKVYVKNNVEESPKDYFRNNITEAVQNKLTEMINKLKQIYKNEYNLQETAQDGENVDADKTTGDTDTSAAAANADNVPKSNNEEKTASAEVDNVTDEENVATETPENAESDNTTLEESTISEGDNATMEEPEHVKGDNAEDAINFDVEDVKSQVTKYSSKYMKNIENYHVTQVGELVKQELWGLLTRVKYDLEAIMYMDKEFVNATLTIAETADRMKRNISLHYVVLTAIPRLPKKVKLKTFLRHFHPNDIKKHRTVRNVLFIGFANPQDQANILKANNTIFENAKLSIKETKNIGNAADTKVEKTETEENDMTEDVQDRDDSLQTDEEVDESSDKLIDSDLDSQIDDLFVSIDNSEMNPSDDSGDDETIDNDENVALNDGEEVQKCDAGENQVSNYKQVISLDDEQASEGSGGAVAVEDEMPAEENKDDKTEDIGVERAVKDKKAALSTPKRTSTRVAASSM